MKKFIIISLVAVGIISCASNPPPPPSEKVVYVTTPLSVPLPPVLPTWKAIDMQCVSTDIKQKILARDRIRQNYIEQLTTVIQSTQLK